MKVFSTVESELTIWLFQLYVKSSKRTVYALILLPKSVWISNFRIDLISLKKLFLLLGFCLPLLLIAQGNDRQLVQFSGFVMSADSMMGIPYVHIGIKGTHRMSTAGGDGFFSFAATEGDTLIFTSIGFKPATYYIPRNVENNKLSVIQLMIKAEYNLPTISIYPWGDREGFKRAFRELRLPKDLIERAEENTNRQLLAALGESLPIDGGEATTRYLQTQAARYYYYGQGAPQNIFNPLAWAEFIRAIKRGDFKKKDSPKLPVKDY